MYEPAHGPWCNTRTWPTKCPGCSGPVFFFSCNCGSRVFFDELGPPWPIHDCDTSWTRKLKRTTDKSGRITVALGKGITVIRNPDSFEIEKPTINRALQAKKAQKPDILVPVEPESKSVRSIVGVLREITHVVCPFKKYRLEDTKMGRAMLGSLGKQKVGRITVHVPLVTKTQSESFTLWIPSALIADSRITRGLTVSLALEGIAVHESGYVWFSDEFEVVG